MTHWERCRRIKTTFSDIELREREREREREIIVSSEGWILLIIKRIMKYAKLMQKIEKQKQRSEQWKEQTKLWTIESKVAVIKLYKYYCIYFQYSNVIVRFGIQKEFDFKS